MRQIVTFGGGGFSMEAGNPLLDDFVLALTGERPAARSASCPRRSGDADHYIVRFYRAFPAGRCEPSHISLFRRDARRRGPRRAPARAGPDLRRRRQRDQPARHVARPRHRRRCCARPGSAASCSAGLSAGSLCWFDRGDHRIPRRRRSGSRASACCRGPTPSTTTSEPERARGVPARLIADGMPPGYAAEDGAALHFVGDELARVVTSRPDARAYRCRSPMVPTWSSASSRREFLGTTRAGRGQPAACRLTAGRAADDPRAWAAAGSPPASATRRSTTTCSRLAGSAAAADLPAPDRERRPERPDPPLLRALRRPAVRAARTSRCSGSAASP